VKNDTPRLLIVKIDAIGDYILFRNFLNEIAISSKYKGYKITLAIKPLLKDLITELDGEVLDSFILVDFGFTFKKWNFLIKELSKFRYTTVINYHYSRNLSTELFTLAASANTKITMSGDHLIINKYLKKLFDLMYHQIVKITTFDHQFEINKVFTEQLLGRELNYIFPQLSLSDVSNVENELPYIVLAPGAGDSYRQMSRLTLLELVSYLIKKYSIHFVGSVADSVIVQDIIEKLPVEDSSKLVDLTGKTKLNDLPYIINRSICVIGNDSGVYHTAVALNKPVLCIAGGGHFRRFVQYAERDNIKVSYHLMPCFNCDWACIYTFPKGNPCPCISNIETNNIIENFKSLERGLYIPESK
jgi:ADP-heptose:LPS heptosyltransferase